MDGIATIGSIQSIFPILAKQIIHFFQMSYYLLLTSGRGRLLGPALGLEKTLHTENKKKNKNLKMVTMAPK